MKSSPHIFIKAAVLTVALAVSGAVFTGRVLAGPCADPILVVNKVADKNDGLCSTDDCSLREAVVTANACPDMQAIQIPAGTYVLTRTGAGEDAASTGDLDLTDQVSLIGTDHPIIDGNGKDRVFDALPAARKVEIVGVTIQNGHAESGGGIRNQTDMILYNVTIQDNTASTSVAGVPANGGGILSEGDNNLDMHSVLVNGNRADYGAGVMVLANGTNSPIFVFDSATKDLARITNNTATDSGGGLWLDSGVTASLDMFEVSKNILVGVPGIPPGGNQGAGIYNAGSLTLTRGKILGNYGGIYGGGIYNAPAASVTAQNLYLAMNVTRMGGGLYNAGRALVYQSGFDTNEANRGMGGAIYNFQSAAGRATMILENVTLSGNIGMLGGGGIYNEGGSLKINLSTIAYNNGEGIHNHLGGRATFRNSILAGHPAGNCAGALPTSSGYNIDDGFSCGFSAAGDLVSTSPMLMGLADNGGWSLTHALSDRSPAIDTADNLNCSPQDEREVARPQGFGCDRGAYEYVP
jgi:CSLREA domain-containing protein